MDVIAHALEWLENNEGYIPDALVLLQPTSPLRTGKHIDEVIAIYEESNPDCVVAVSKAARSPDRMKVMDKQGRLAPFLPEDYPVLQRKQGCPQAWISNGSIWILRREYFLKYKELYAGQTHAYVMPTSESLDIDLPWDFKLAELILNNTGG